MDCGSREDSEGPQGRQSGNLGGITTAAKKTACIVFFGSITNSRQMKRQHVFFAFQDVVTTVTKKAILKLFFFMVSVTTVAKWATFYCFFFFIEKARLCYFLCRIVL